MSHLSSTEGGRPLLTRVMTLHVQDDIIRKHMSDHPTTYASVKETESCADLLVKAGYRRRTGGALKFRYVPRVQDEFTSVQYGLCWYQNDEEALNWSHWIDRRRLIISSSPPCRRHDIPKPLLAYSSDCAITFHDSGPCVLH